MMSTPERCRAQADEAERLAALVSYGRDRTRLLGEAEAWRVQAAELEEVQTAPEAPPVTWLQRCSHALFGSRGPRGG